MSSTASGFFLAILLVLLLVASVKPTSAAWNGETIYIRADGSIDPPNAPLVTYDKTTYTLVDNVIFKLDGIVVERSNIILNGAGYKVGGSGEGVGVYVRSGVSNITITGMILEGFEIGIKFDYSSGNTVSGNIIVNTLQAGIELYNSQGNTITGNSFINSGLFLYNSFGNTVENNTVNGKLLVYLENKSSITVSNVGQVILVNCRDIIVRGIELSNTTVGVELWNTHGALITGNIIMGNTKSGIYLGYSSNNTIIANYIVGNKHNGVELNSSTGNNITRNNILRNQRAGIYIDYSSGNTIVENIIRDNYYGVYIHASGNSIFHNNFYYNTVNAEILGGSNKWDNGYPSGGNYWSNYTDIDEYSGPNQNEPGSDGIWDHPYKIDENNIDHYPLVEPRLFVIIAATMTVSETKTETVTTTVAEMKTETKTVTERETVTSTMKETKTVTERETKTTPTTISITITATAMDTPAMISTAGIALILGLAIGLLARKRKA